MRLEKEADVGGIPMKHYEAYGIATRNTKIQGQFYRLADEEVFIHHFEPLQKNNDIILLLHGYMDHSLTSARLINRLISEGFEVVALDWPGHGLSKGETYHIQSFRQYNTIFLQLVQDMIERWGSDRIHLIAHSTGAGVVLDGLTNNLKEMPTGGIVLTSPLIKLPSHRIGKLFLPFVRKWRKQVRRIYRTNSSDPLFMKAIEEDPLQHEVIPLTWFDAYLQWHEDMRRRAKCSAENVTILQGTRDTTVHWKTNMKWLAETLPSAERILIDGGGHHLWNEGDLIRELVFRFILKRLKKT
ncbi:alpha/beta hydrolase [Halalkalibacterium halodurans]|jgi:lysophospholipase|nr:alpha/beta hydrolase [Halalkalibacterium halodurans]